jgi:hypothetical protein
MSIRRQRHLIEWNDVMLLIDSILAVKNADYAPKVIIASTNISTVLDSWCLLDNQTADSYHSVIPSD